MVDPHPSELGDRVCLLEKGLRRYVFFESISIRTESLKLQRRGIPPCPSRPGNPDLDLITLLLH